MNETSESLHGDHPTVCDAERTYLQDGQSVLVLALLAAATAGQRQEVPVGAVLRDVAGRFLSESGNNTLAAADPTGHAELRALRQGAARIGNYRLVASTLTVTLEPCAMCYAALAMARVKKITFEVKSPRFGAMRDDLPEKQSAVLSACLVEGEPINQVVNQPVVTHAKGSEAGAGPLLRIFFAEKRKT